MSNSCITLEGLCTLCAKDPVGCCWRGVNAVNVTMSNLYLQSLKPKGKGSAPGLVIEGGYKISASMHVEGPSPVVLAQHGEVSDVDLYLPTTPRFLLIKAAFQSRALWVQVLDGRHDGARREQPDQP